MAVWLELIQFSICGDIDQMCLIQKINYKPTSKVSFSLIHVCIKVCQCFFEFWLRFLWKCYKYYYEFCGRFGAFRGGFFKFACDVVVFHDFFVKFPHLFIKIQKYQLFAYHICNMYVKVLLFLYSNTYLSISYFSCAIMEEAYM